MSRVLRIVIGFALVSYAIYSSNEWFFLGFIPLITGLVNYCPMEKLMGGCKEDSCETGSCCSPKEDTKNQCCSTSINDTNKQECCSTNEDVITIEILGTGCANCKALFEVATKVTSQMEENFEIIKVEDLEEIMKYNVVSTPGFVVNKKVKSTGKLLNMQSMKELIEEEL